MECHRFERFHCVEIGTLNKRKPVTNEIMILKSMRPDKNNINFYILIKVNLNSLSYTEKRIERK